MNYFDTISLLKACNQGCKYATNSMESLYPHIKSQSLRQVIDDFNNKHIEIGDKCHELLNDINANEKDPKPMASMFAKMSIDIKMLVDGSDEKVAEMMFDGCNMGIKTVGKYLNKYTEASNDSKKLAKDLIGLEQDFISALMVYL